jgi:pimeloyl-ACP methyl ester carboxylesterase
VLQFADALGIDGFSIVGHSMGGRTAVEVAAKAPARVRGLVCLASVGTRRHRGYVIAPWVLQALDTLVRAPLLRPALIRVVRRGYARAGFRGDYSEEELVHHMQHVSAIDFAGARRAAARVRCPTLVCAADDDRLIEPVIADELADAIAGARVLHFESGGHNIQKTRALAIAVAICVLLAA